MGNRKKDLRFWGRSWLGCMGLILVISLVMLLVYGLQSEVYAKSGMGGMLLAGAYVYPFYLYIAGAVVVLVVSLSYCQLYFSILVSMNVTRGAVVGGMTVTLAAIVLGVTALAAAIWGVLGNPGTVRIFGLQGGDMLESSGEILSVLPLAAGIFLIVAAVSVLLGTVMMKWGKLGIIAAVLICTGAGGFAGAWAALSGAVNLIQVRGIHVDSKAYLVLAAGALLYLLAGVLARAATRNLEVRT